mgnify:CR=1 FL=1
MTARGGVRLVAGVDPGLDVCGVAVVAFDALARPLAVVSVASVRSDRTADGAARLASIAAGLRRELRAQPLAAVVVEVPQFLGVARERTQRGGAHMVMRGLAGYFQALGVVRATVAASGIPTLEAPPSSARKQERQAAAALFTQHGRNDDERDAIVVACALGAMALQQAAAPAEVATLSSQTTSRPRRPSR